MQKSDAINYAPNCKPKPVCNNGEFKFAAIALDHGHIYGMCEGLIEAGATLEYVYDQDAEKIKAFLEKFPYVKVAKCQEEILNEKSIKMVASAAVPNLRGPLGVTVMQHGKDYFVDKCPFTSLNQLSEARKTVKETGMKYMVYYSERLHVESAIFAEQLIKDGAIGKVVQVLGLGPHRLGESRPDWFFKKEQYGGIICDIGSHQIEQYLAFTGEIDATVVSSHVANYNHSEHQELEDFGEASLIGKNGTSNYFRVDWFTPNGLGTWGDGRTFILGTNGYIEIRKYIDVARDKISNNIYLVDNSSERYIHAEGLVGFPFFGELILDCLNRTEIAMTQEHVFKATELSMIAQEKALIKY